MTRLTTKCGSSALRSPVSPTMACCTCQHLHPHHIALSDSKCDLLGSQLNLHVCVRRADHVLGDQESPLAAKLSWKGPTDHAQFHLRRRTSGMVRVFAQLSEGYETFHNIIVQPHASTREVVQQLVDKYFRKWNPHQLELVEVTPQAGVCSCLHVHFGPHTSHLYGILWWL